MYQPHQRQHPTRPQTQPAGESTRWTRMHDRAFERAIAIFPEHHSERWQRMAENVPGNWSPAEMRERYEMLLHDVIQIESGRVELPCYPDDPEAVAVHRGLPPVLPPPVRSKKGTAWTEEEHKLFLIGLGKYGRGDWRSIARYVVVTRSPTQVASHAQKYFLRQNASMKERKRTSIHDITIGDNDLVPHPTHQQNWVPPPDVPMQQLHEMQQLNPPNNFPYQMQQLNPPTNLPHQMGGFEHYSF